MSGHIVPIKVVAEDRAFIPQYQTDGAAGADICAYLEEPYVLEPGARYAVPTGLFLEVAEGYEVQIRPRSGLAAKFGITCLNTPGTIDSDYRGEIKVILINLGNSDFVISNGDRIAQMVVSPLYRAEFEIVDELSESDRGEGGFGSTGVSSVE